MKIINFLNFLIFTIFLNAINVFSMFDSHIKMIIFIAFIFCIRFISCFFLTHVIQFIFLFNFRFKKTLILRKKNVEVAIVDYSSWIREVKIYSTKLKRCFELTRNWFNCFEINLMIFELILKQKHFSKFNDN